MPYRPAVRDGVLPGAAPVRCSLLLHAFHSVCRVAASQVERAVGETSVPPMALASVLSEAMTTVNIAHLLLTGQSPRVALPGGSHTAPGRTWTAHQWGPRVT